MDFRKQAEALVSQMTLDEKLGQMVHTAPAIPRLGIPAYNWWSEAPHGAARCGVATVFPQSIGMAASFNTDLMEEVGRVASTEARAKYNEFKKQGFTDRYQGLTVCGPVLNIARDPRWGRIQETYGEDPYLTGRMGTAFIRGMQGDGVYHRTDTVVEHFAAHSGPENGRLNFNTNVSDADLFETYTAAFKYCIDNADPAAIMPAYNNFRGIPCCASRFLITDLLREKFGFKGFIESDAGAVESGFKNQTKHATPAEMAAACVNAGCDLSIHAPEADGGSVYAQLREAVDADLLSEETVTEAVTRLFEARCRLGMFADDCEYDAISYDVLECPAHRAVNYQMAQEGIVLLKNDGILPLDPKQNIAVIGPNADERLVLLGNYYGYPTHYSTFLQGIRQQAEGNLYFARGITPEGVRENPAETHAYEAVIAAQKSDVVVMFMGLNPVMESEECDFNGDKTTLELPDNQKAIYELVKATGKPIVYVNVSGSCVNLYDQNNECNAVVQCFYPGADGGNAFADILFGKASPGGRLPLTFYRTCKDLPPIDDYSMQNRTYKFYKGTPVYEFGYGLTYSDIDEQPIDERSVRITNHGPFDTMYSVLKFKQEPHKELVGFEKVFLKVGETKIVTFRAEKAQGELP